MSLEEFIYAVRDRAETLRRTPELERTRLALMRQLQASLLASRNALLALDLAAIGQGTREQVELSLRLGENIGILATSAVRIGRLIEPRPASGCAALAPELEPELTADLKRAELDVMQALRLQSALLARARAKLRVLANMLAGPSVNYGPPCAPRSARPRAFAFKGGEI
ncbi:MAG: hypothetical protein WB538_19200 [Candidatus Sulfotelmatobacter sp.]